jgi:hypothetical protein
MKCPNCKDGEYATIEVCKCLSCGDIVFTHEQSLKLDKLRRAFNHRKDGEAVWIPEMIKPPEGVIAAYAKGLIPQNEFTTNAFEANSWPDDEWGKEACRLWCEKESVYHGREMYHPVQHVLYYE